MIIHLSENGELEYPVSFEELQTRFPFTSFCDPIQQTALPDGYFLAAVDTKPNTLVPLKPRHIIKEGMHFIVWERENIEFAEMEKIVQDKIETLTKESDWAVRDDVPDFISNKYKEYRKKLWSIPEQVGYPYDVEFPEVK